MSTGITKWLEGLGLGEYADLFVEQRIDEDVIPELTDNDLRVLDIPLGPRKKLLKAIAKLDTDAGASEPQETHHSRSPDSSDAARRQLTVLFCDLAGSTELSERLDPEDLQDVNRVYQNACKAAVERYEGFIARYMGDGVLTYFGYPQAHEDDAERAIRAGLDVVDAMGDLNRASVKEHGVELRVRVGIATGPVVVGDIVGEGASQESTVVGRTPNLAARLQELAEINTVMISPETHNLVGGRFEYEELGSHEIKGISEPVRLRRVVAASVVESRFEARRGTEITPLVGRVHEVGLLLERWEYAREGDGQLVLVAGEPGIGKSRISESLRERIAADDPVQLRYQCSPYHINSALYPVIEQLQGAAQFEREDSNTTRLNKLEALLDVATPKFDVLAPLIASLLSIPSDGRYRPLDMTREQQKDKTLEALVSQMEVLSRHRPILMIFEDVHWADPTSLDLLGNIIDRLPGMATLAVITFRPEFFPPWTGRSHVTLLTLSRFSRSLSVSMIDEVTGGKRLPDEVRDQIIDKTDGVPLFVEELTKTVIESNLIEVRGDQYTLTGPLTKLAIPSTLHDSLMARLDRLAPVREVAQIAAVIGREFSHRVLAAVSPLTEEALEDAMAQLMNAALVFRRGAPQRAQYIFKHALVRDAAYESLLKRKRRELHGRIAEALEIELAETVESEPELLAHHYTESGLIERALPNWLRAGQKAVEHGANKEAATHLRRGLELLVTVPNNDALTRLEISFRVALGVPLLNIEGAGSPEVADNYSRAQTLCEKVGDTEQLFPVVWGMWYHAMMSSDIRRACELGDKLLEVAEQQNDESLLLEAHHCQWPSRFLMGDMNGTLHHCDRGRKLYNADVHHALTFTYGGHDPGVCARNMGSMALYLTGYPDQAKERSEEGLELARCLGHAGSLSEALVFAIYISLMTRDVRVVEQCADALEENFQSEQLQIHQIFVDTARGYVLTQKRLVDQGLVRIREAMKSLTPGGVWEEPLLSLVASTIGQHGEIERGRELVDKALKLAQQRDIRWWEAEFHRVRGELLLANGSDDTASAEHCFKEAIDVARRQRAKSLELRATISLVRVWRDLDKPRTAHELLVPLYEWFTEGFDTPDLMEAKALLNELA